MPWDDESEVFSILVLIPEQQAQPLFTDPTVRLGGEAPDVNTPPYQICLHDLLMAIVSHQGSLSLDPLT